MILIIGCIIGYFAIGVFLFGIVSAYTDDVSEDMAGILFFAWPICLILAVLALVVSVPLWLGTEIGRIIKNVHTNNSG